jgi:hypothetical protein
MVYVVGGAIAVGLVGYGVYKAAQYMEKVQAAESSASGDGGVP